MADLADILKSALNLDRKDRATLAERLIASIDDAPGAKSDEEWAEIAQRRLEEFRSGKVKTIPAEVVHEEVRRMLQ